MDRSSQTTFLQLGDASIHTSFTPAVRPRPDGLTLVILHGAGQSSSQRFTAFSKTFTAAGIPVAALDFIGHGKTGGNTHDNSLQLRTQHALAAIAHWTKPAAPLILCGSSMSGHTALQVASELGERVKSLCLLQPAVYAAEAQNIAFGPEFTSILRQAGSWQSSPALQDARRFMGKALVMIGGEDAVIPWGVIEALVNNFKQSARQTRLEVFSGVGHELPTWLPEHPMHCQQLLDYLLDE